MMPLRRKMARRWHAHYGARAGRTEGFVMLKFIVFLAMAGVLALAASSNSIEGFGRDAGFDPDASPPDR